MQGPDVLQAFIEAKLELDFLGFFELRQHDSVNLGLRKLLPGNKGIK